MRQKLLFLPSAWSNESVFGPQIEILKKDYDILTPNIALFNSISKAAERIVSDYHQVDCVIGLSLGGFVAIEILTKYPDFCTKAILMGTHAHAIPEDKRAFYQNLIEAVSQGELYNLCPFFGQAVISISGQANKNLMTYVNNMPLAVGAAGCMNHHKAALSYEDKTHLLKNINAKTLLVAGENDEATPLSELEVLHAHIPNSALVIIKNAGHFMTLENPNDTTQAIREWLQ